MPERAKSQPPGPALGEERGKRRGLGVARVWRRVVLLQHGYAEINKATGGAFAFNTTAKILAWAGICAIVGLLLHKVHQIQAELDPVGRGLAQLQQQLKSANSSVASSTQASEVELDALRTRAERLKASLDSASKTERDQSEPTLLKARQEARDLADALAKEAEGLQEVAEARAALTRSLTDYRDSLLQGQQLEVVQALGLADGGAAAASALRGLSDAAGRATATVNGAAAGLQLDQLGRNLDTLRSKLAELQRQVDRVTRQLAEASPPQPPAPVPLSRQKATASLVISPIGSRAAPGPAPVGGHAE